MNTTSYMTRAERLQRIGELLAKGITLMLMREAEDKQPAESALKVATVDESGTRPCEKKAENGAPKLEETEQKIFEYLKRVRKASPRDIQLNLELSKATVFRKLTRLAEAKLVIRSGSTTAIRYRLAGRDDYRYLLIGGSSRSTEGIESGNANRSRP